MSPISNSSSVVNCELNLDEIVARTLEDTLGPRHVSDWYRYTFGFLYSLLLISGGLGNLATCLVIAVNKHMHRPTNLYLFSLSVSDLLILLFGLPVELVQSQTQMYPWPWGRTMCHLRILMLELTPVASVLTIVAFSLERYVAICHPVRAHLLSSRRRTCLVLALAWLLSLGLAAPISAMSLSQHVVYYPTSVNLSSNCITNYSFPDSMPIPDSLSCFPNIHAPGFKQIITFNAVTMFLLPLLFISALYLLIARKLFYSTSTSVGTGSITHNNHNRALDSRKTVIKMLAVVVVSFFACWASYHLQRLITLYPPRGTIPSAILTPLFYISGSLLYVSPTVNPAIYNLMSARFRRTSIQTFRRGRDFFCCRKQASSNLDHYYDLTTTRGGGPVALPHGERMVVMTTSLITDNRLRNHRRRHSNCSICSAVSATTIPTPSRRTQLHRSQECLASPSRYDNIPLIQVHHTHNHHQIIDNSDLRLSLNCLSTSTLLSPANSNNNHSNIINNKTNDNIEEVVPVSASTPYASFPQLQWRHKVKQKMFRTYRRIPLITMSSP